MKNIFKNYLKKSWGVKKMDDSKKIKIAMIIGFTGLLGLLAISTYIYGYLEGQQEKSIEIANFFNQANAIDKCSTSEQEQCRHMIFEFREVYEDTESSKRYIKFQNNAIKYIPENYYYISISKNNLELIDEGEYWSFKPTIQRAE